MGKLARKDNGINKQFKPQIQNSYRSNSGDRRIQFGGRTQYGQNRGRPRYKQNYRNDYRRGNFRGNVRMYWNFGRQNNRGGYIGNYRNDHYNREWGRSRSRERSLPDNNSWRRDRSISNSRSRSGSRASTNKERIRCYKWREYDHFLKDCPTTNKEREIVQIQQMFNLDGEQMSLITLATSDTYDNLSHTSSLEDVRSEHLNL